MPRGSGEYQRISPGDTAIGNHPLAYALMSASVGIIGGGRQWTVYGSDSVNGAIFASNRSPLSSTIW